MKIYAAITLLLFSGESAVSFACQNALTHIELWEKGCLRGANMFQQEKYSSDYVPRVVWNPMIKQQDLADLRASGANYVNFSIPGTYDVKTYQPRNDFLTQLNTLIDQAAEADLFIVLSFRTGPGRGEGDITNDGYLNRELFNTISAQQAFLAMWKNIARHYADHKNIVGYDILTEPHDVNRAAWRSLAQKTIDAIRTVDTDTPVLISPDAWGVADSLQGWRPLQGDNLVYTVHQYEPYNYTHHNNATGDPISTMAAKYSAILQWRTTYNKPIAINEYGIAKNTDNAVPFMQKQVDLLDQNQFSHAAWIWEVEYDPDYTYDKFDFKDNPGLLSVIKSSWQYNAITPNTSPIQPPTGLRIVN